METTATFFDGEVAADRTVTLSLGGGRLEFSGDGVPRQVWPFADLVAIDRPAGGAPFRLTSTRSPGSRLVIRDGAFVAALVHGARHLRGGFNPKRTGKMALWFATGVGGLALAIYVVVQLAPQRLAQVIPDSWRDRVGAQIEASLTEGAVVCDSPAARTSLSIMVGRLAQAYPDLPPVTVRVYAIPVVNAFAMPGDRVVITAELIARAETPEEVAGILAHELGHVVNRHPETQIIRVTGLEVLLGIATGGGSTISGFAELAAILSYSRDAESEADAFAVKTMTAASIDPMGLRRFFERLLKEEGKGKGGPLAKIEGVFSTHPGTEERIETIHPLPAGAAPVPILDAAQWQALKKICS